MSTLTQAMIMSAGTGKRLEPLTLSIPKPLVPLHDNGLTCLDLSVMALTAIGIKKIVVNTFHLPQQITDFIHNKYAFVTLSHEHEPLETGGGLVHALSHFDQNQPLFILNGDMIIENLAVNLVNMNRFFNQHFSPNDILLGIAPLKSEHFQNIGFHGHGDCFYNPQTADVTLRKPPENAPYAFIGPRIFGANCLNIDYLKKFQHPAKKFSQTQIFRDKNANAQLKGFCISDAWYSITTVEDLYLIKKHLNNSRA